MTISTSGMPGNTAGGKIGRKKLLAAAAIIIVVIIIVWFFLPKGKAEAPATETATSTQQIAAPIVSVNKQSQSEDTYTVDADTPVVSGIADGAVLKSINDQLSAKVDSSISDFKTQVAGNAPVEDGPGTLSSLTIQLEFASTTKNSVLAVRMEISTYFSGAAHPLTFSSTSNFDLATGKDLQLIDLFDPSVKDSQGVDYLNKISQYATASLKTQLAASFDTPEDQLGDIFFADGSDSNPENFSAFLLENDGMRVIFGQYQVAPYAAGEQEVLIPYSELSAYFIKGPLADSLLK